MNEQNERDVLALATRMGQCPADLREWAEPLAYKDLESRVASSNAISAQAGTTVAVLLAGLGGFGGWALKVLEPGAGAAAWGALAASVWLAALLIAAVHWCINLRDTPAIYNRPANLVIPDATLEQVRLGELANLDASILKQAAFDARRATALNRVRLAAAATPLIGLAAGLAAWCWL